MDNKDKTTKEIKINFNEDPSEIKVDETTKKKQNKQLGLIVIIIALVFIGFLSGYLIAKNWDKRFTLGNLKFTKQELKGLTLYTTKIPVVDKGNITSTYEISFKNDPRKLKDIPIADRITTDGVKFIKDNPVYISIDPNMNACSDNSVAMMTIGSFLKDSGLTVDSAMSDKEYADAIKYKYMDCSNSGHTSVIMVKSGNSTKIEQKMTNCYVIQYKECEILPVSERFILQIVEEYMNRTEVKNLMQ